MAKILLDEKEYVDKLMKSFDGERYDKTLVDISQSQLIYLLAKYLYMNEDWGTWRSKDGNEYHTPKIWSEKEVVDVETGEIIIERKCSSKALTEKATYLANKLDNIMLKFNFDNYESYLIFKQLKKACSTVIKYDLCLKDYKDGIPLLSDELENIKNCDTDREKKVLFACYIYARYRNKNGRIDDDIVKKQLFDMANVKGTKLELNKVIKSLREKGFISQSFVNSNITIWVNMGSGEEILRVTDINTLGNQIMVYLKKDYNICKICKKLYKKNKYDYSSIYCKKCSDEQTYYQKKETKLINCIDCGQEIFVVATDNNTKRCDKCRIEYNNNNRMKNFYKKKYDDGYILLYKNNYYLFQERIISFIDDGYYIESCLPPDEYSRQKRYPYQFSITADGYNIYLKNAMMIINDFM